MKYTREEGKRRGRGRQMRIKRNEVYERREQKKRKRPTIKSKKGLNVMHHIQEKLKLKMNEQIEC